jgi:hypothetical protein
MAPTGRFRAAAQDAKISPNKDIPHVTAPMIIKYINDLQLLGLLYGDRQHAVSRHLQPERGLLAAPPGAVLQASARRPSPLQCAPRHGHLLSLPGL